MSGVRSDGAAVSASIGGSDGIASLVQEALTRWAIDDGPLALVSAGWQEWEGIGEALDERVVLPVEDLALYARSEAVLEADPKLAAAVRRRNTRLRALQSDYRVRLAHAAAAVRALPAIGHDGEHHPHREDAVRALRALDRRHVQHLRAALAEPLPASAALDDARATLAEAMSRYSAVLLAGGHVAVLRNRLRLLAADALVARTRCIAWGAGAMVLGERIVLFLDHGARGPREPEIVDTGLGVLPRLVALPSATTRLDLSDRARLATLSRRFAPARCISLNGSARLHYEDARLVAASGAFRLDASGRMPRVRHR